jgi:hypothetical protein
MKEKAELKRGKIGKNYRKILTCCKFFNILLTYLLCKSWTAVGWEESVSLTAMGAIYASINDVAA